MIENIRMIKEWYKIARPKTSDFILQISTFVLNAICFVICTLLVAKVTANLSSGNYKAALIYLCVGFGLLVVRNLSTTVSYHYSGKILDHTYMSIHKKIYHKLLSATKSNFDNFNKQKIINIYHSAAYNIGMFSHTLACGLSKLVRLIVTLIIVVQINLPIACILLAVDILNFFILNFCYSKVAGYNKLINESVDIQHSTISDIFDSKSMLEDMKMDVSAEKEFTKDAQRTSTYYKKRLRWSSAIDNGYFVFYSAIVFVLTLSLMLILTKGGMTLESYFIIVPYLTTAITDANEFYAMFTELKTINVHVERVKAIFNFSDKELLEFGKNNLDEITGTIDFMNVSFKSSPNDDIKLPKINDLSFHINENELTLIYGNRGSGKRTIFYLLRRQVCPTDGKILISGIDAFNYTRKIYASNITYTTTKPIFFKGSIMKNLKMVEKNKERIYKMCRKLNIYSDIMCLRHKFNTNVDDLPDDLKYLVSVCRSFLTQSEIIMLYEFPTYLSDNQKSKVVSVLQEMKKSKTIIVFSASSFCTEFCDKIISLDDGEIKDISFNNN